MRRRRDDSLQEEQLRFHFLKKKNKQNSFDIFFRCGWRRLSKSLEQHWPTIMRAGQPTIPDTHEQSNLLYIILIVVSFYQVDPEKRKLP